MTTTTTEGAKKITNKHKGINVFFGRKALYGIKYDWIDAWNGFAGGDGDASTPGSNKSSSTAAAFFLLVRSFCRCFHSHWSLLRAELFSCRLDKGIFDLNFRIWRLREICGMVLLIFDASAWIFGGEFHFQKLIECRPGKDNRLGGMKWGIRSFAIWWPF